MKIEIWADYACPFCYIGKTTLEQAIEKIGLKDVEIVYKAFQLDPNAPQEASEDTVTHLAHKYGVSVQESEQMVNRVVQQGKSTGLDLRFDLVQNTNTFDAHRLTKYAKALGKASELNIKLYEAYFTRGMNLANRNHLNEIAESIGLDSKELERKLNSKEYENEVKLDMEEAFRKGIRAVPYFLIDGKTSIKGAQSVEYFIRVLSQ
jgi:predicted DsbA family dithiol-disulfide isomerase